MAKQKKETTGLHCPECKEINYVTVKSKRFALLRQGGGAKTGPSAGQLERNKYCARCQKHTLHKEKKIHRTVNRGKGN